MPNSHISIDASVTSQRIDNFGASDAWSMDVLGKYWVEDNKTRVADLLFSREKGIGPQVWMTKNGHAQAESTVGSTNLKEEIDTTMTLYGQRKRGGYSFENR